MNQPTLTYFRSLWTKSNENAWLVGLSLIFLFGIPRFILVLQANVSGSFQWVSIIFMLMWASPFIFLTRAGRKAMKLTAPGSWKWIGLGLLLGIGACFLMMVIFQLLYDESMLNAFVYTGKGVETTPFDSAFFIIYLLISMTISPVGEEFFYRGVIHLSFEEKWGDAVASMIDSTAFSLTHLAHFGIIYHLEKWTFEPMPALIWVLGMFLLCLVFIEVKKGSGSIWGAVITHAGFNFAMGCGLFLFL